MKGSNAGKLEINGARKSLPVTLLGRLAVDRKFTPLLVFPAFKRYFCFCEAREHQQPVFMNSRSY